MENFDILAMHLLKYESSSHRFSLTCWIHCQICSHITIYWLGGHVNIGCFFICAAYLSEPREVLVCPFPFCKYSGRVLKTLIWLNKELLSRLTGLLQFSSCTRSWFVCKHPLYTWKVFSQIAVIASCHSKQFELHWIFFAENIFGQLICFLFVLNNSPNCSLLN